MQTEATERGAWQAMCDRRWRRHRLTSSFRFLRKSSQKSTSHEVTSVVRINYGTRNVLFNSAAYVVDIAHGCDENGGDDTHGSM